MWKDVVVIEDTKHLHGRTKESRKYLRIVGSDPQSNLQPSEFKTKIHYRDIQCQTYEMCVVLGS